MNNFILSYGAYILGGVLILAFIVKLFTKNPPAPGTSAVILLFGFILVALPFASRISIDVKGVKLDLQTATQQVEDLQKRIVELSNENTELTNKVTDLNNQIAVLNDPHASQNQKAIATMNMSAGINDINSRLANFRLALDSVQLKSTNASRNLRNIKTGRWILK
jgi:cell division protein FtsB